MFAMSDRFVAALAGSHTRIVTAELWNGKGQMVATVDVIGGRITASTADVQCTVSLTIASPDGKLVPNALADPLAPFGSEIVIRAGIRYADGSSETAPMGRFRISSSRARDEWAYSTKYGWVHRGAVIDIEAQDRTAYLARSGLTYTMSRAATALITDELRTLVSPCAPVGLMPTSALTIGPGVIYDMGEGSRLAAIKRIMPADWQYRMDRNGVFTVVSQQTTYPVFDIEVSATKGLLTYEQEWTNERYYNAVVTSAQNKSDLNPIQGMAVEKAYPIGWGSNYGYVPTFRSGLPMTTQKELDDAAAKFLSEQINGRFRRATLVIPPDPRIDIGDSVGAYLPNAAFWGRVKGWTFPLIASDGAMSLEVEVREETYVSVTA